MLAASYAICVDAAPVASGRGHDDAGDEWQDHEARRRVRAPNVGRERS
jgi:hypothetical protein